MEVIAKARVLLAPIPFGAGIKGKFIDAMRVGTPNVTTRVGIEAMATPEEWSGCCADEVEEFVSKAVELYQDEALWKVKQQKGVDIIQKYYSKTHFTAACKAKIIDMDTTLEQYRKTNFLKEVFKHHSAQSTKYMALWIEEKNKHKKSE